MSDHEETDARIGVIPWAVLICVVSLAVIFAAVWWMFRFFQTEDASRNVSRTDIQQPSPIPPEPRLQINPEEDLERYRREQKQWLDSYGWVSPGEQRVRIPIDRAMELVVEGKQP